MTNHEDDCKCAVCSGKIDPAGFYEKFARDIEKSGQSLVGVLGETGSAPFIYTIGNHSVGLPELLLIGNASAAIGHVMNILGEKLRERGRSFDEGELVDIGGKFPLKIITANDPRALDDYAVQARQFYNHDVQVQQVLVPDLSGRYPGDALAAPPYSEQPILQTKPH